MNDPLLIDLGREDAPGASGLPAQEPPADRWVVVRSTAYRNGLAHGETCLINTGWEDAQREMRHGWLVPVNSDEQPNLVTDPETGQPTLVEENDAD